MESPAPAEGRFVLKDSRKHVISGFRLGRVFMFTFFDPGANQWGFEHWDGKAQVETKMFRRAAREAEEYFGKAVEKHVGMWNAHARHRPLVNRHHLPRGVKGVPTFDPAKRNTNRSILDSYPVVDPDD